MSAVSGVPAEEVEQRLGALVGPARSFFRLWLNTKGIKLRQEEVRTGVWTGMVWEHVDSV